MQVRGIPQVHIHGPPCWGTGSHPEPIPARAGESHCHLVGKGRIASALPAQRDQTSSSKIPAPAGLRDLEKPRVPGVEEEGPHRTEGAPRAGVWLQTPEEGRVERVSATFQNLLLHSWCHRGDPQYPLRALAVQDGPQELKYWSHAEDSAVRQTHELPCAPS